MPSAAALASVVVPRHFGRHALARKVGQLGDDLMQLIDGVHPLALDDQMPGAAQSFGVRAYTHTHRFATAV
jgi:hypothetical protein